MNRCALLCVGLAASVARAEFVAFEVVDAQKRPTPVRMEIRDAVGGSYVPDAALPVQMGCPSEPVPNDAPGCITGFKVTNFLDNPHTGTRQFYVDRAFTIDLPVGAYTVAVFKGIEHRVVRQTLDVVPFETGKVTIVVERWSDLAAQGWFSADEHLHVQRVAPSDDETIARWAQAEDLNVMNLIQVGTEKSFDVSVQYAFGDPGTYLAGNTMILSGQESPRTHVFGHALILGADTAIASPGRYSVYDAFFKLGAKLGGVNGYAHWGLGPAERGLALDAPQKTLSFIEVLQFEFGHYGLWYQLLNLGIPVAPTAGTDFPCGPWSMPGRERFYARVEGPLTRKSWLEAIRKGRTFVTNGPLLEFHVDGADIGDQRTLAKAQHVVVRGTVRFDPTRDTIDAVQLIQNGVATVVKTTVVGPGLLTFEQKQWVGASGWFALRATGAKLHETPLIAQTHSDLEYEVAASYSAGVSMKERESYAAGTRGRPSEAHTGAIHVAVTGTPAVSRQPRSRQIARAWLRKLDLLELSLEDENIGALPLELSALPNSDGVSLDDLMRSRPQLRALIAYARAYYESLL